MRLVTPVSADFGEYWDSLVARSRLTPVYASGHLRYYEWAVKADIVADLSAVVVRDDDVVAGARLILSTNGNGRVLDYFGMPAPIVLPTALSKESEVAGSVLAHHLFGMGLKNLMREGLTAFSATFPMHRAITSPIAGLFFECSHRIYPEFLRVLELEGEDLGAGPRKTKSVKTALKAAANEGLTCRILDSASSPEEIREAVTNLQRLHFVSAARRTRSQESWDEQRECIERGSAFLVQGALDGEVVGAAFFLTAGPSAYYGVSANNAQYRHISLSHVLVNETVDYLVNSAFERLFLGSQFSEKSRQVSSKEVQIERFKSLFGGQILCSLIADRFG